MADGGMSATAEVRRGAVLPCGSIMTTKTLPALSLLTLLATGCASSGAGGPSGDLPPLFGVAGRQLVGLEPATGAVDDSAEVSGVEGIATLAYDPGSGTAYGIADADTEPRLMALRAGEVREVGKIELPPGSSTRIDAVAFDPGTGRLYLTAGNALLADHLVTVDPETGMVGSFLRISGTAQDEVDAMAFAGNALYAVDAVLGESHFYRLDPETARATRIGGPYPGEITDLAFDATRGRLVGTVAADRRMVALTTGGTLTELGPTHAEADLDGALLRALDAAYPANGAPYLFSDSFESGDLSAWRMEEGDDGP